MSSIINYIVTPKSAWILGLGKMLRMAANSTPMDRGYSVGGLRRILIWIRVWIQTRLYRHEFKKDRTNPLWRYHLLKGLQRMGTYIL
jgi:hypothetical protein